MDSGDDRYSTVGVGLDWTLIPGPVSALIDTELVKLGESATLEFKSTLQWDVVHNQPNKTLRRPGQC